MTDTNIDIQKEENQTFLTKKEEVAKKEEESESFEGYLGLFKISVAEGIAYFFVILNIYLSGGDHAKFVFAFWSIFMVFGNVSGAHVNPIVTIALWINKGNMFKIKNLAKLFSYILFQFFGGILGALVAYRTYKKKIIYVKAGDDDSDLDIWGCEGFFSGTFVFVCLFITSTATRPTDKNHVNLTLFAVWLYIIINAGQDISGGCYNPTVYIILNGLAYYTSTDIKAYNNIEIYILAPLVGSIIFTLIFKYVFKPFYIAKNRIVISEDD